MIETTDPQVPDGESVSYDGAPVAEIRVGDLEYRVDAGLGAVVAISRREAGASTWVPVAQGRWDGVRLRAKALEHSVTSALERALMLVKQDEAFT